jgi:hypothetical protein
MGISKDAAPLKVAPSFLPAKILWRNGRISYSHQVTLTHFFRQPKVNLAHYNIKLSMLKNVLSQAEYQWLMLVALATPEAKVRRTVVQASLGK